MKNKYVFVIDMINGFIKEGALHDEKIMNIVPNIQKIISTNENVIFIVDSHNDNSSEFNAFPSHCLEGTFESQVIDELKPFIKNETSQIIKKNSTNAMWAVNCQELLKKTEDVVLVGCCTDICVLHFALSLKTFANQNNINCNITVVSDAVATYDAPGHNANEYSEMALKLMSLAGIQIKKTKELI